MGNSRAAFSLYLSKVNLLDSAVLTNWGQKLIKGVDDYYAASKAANITLFNLIERILPKESLQNANLLIQLGSIYKWYGQLDKALANYTRAIELEPKSAKWLNQRAELLESIKRYEEALADFARAIELEPRNAKHFSDRADLLGRMKRFDEALYEFARAIELEPRNAKHFSDRADLLGKMKRYKEALYDYTHAIELEPQSTDYINYRANLLLYLSRYEDALIDYKRIIELKPKSDHYFGQCADALSELERYEEAIEFYTRAIELRAERMKHRESQSLRVGDTVQIIIEPLNYEARRANIYRLMGHYEKALADYDRAIDEEKRQKGKPLTMRARLFQELGMYDKALADRKQAIAEFTHEIEQGGESDFFFADHLIGRAELFGELDRHEEELADLNKLIQLNPDTSTYFAYRAEVNRKLNRHEETLADLNHAFELEPGEAVNFENRAAYFIDQERYEEALNDIDQALKLKLDSEDDSNTALINLRGLVLSYLGRYDKALECYRGILDTEPENYATLYNTATATSRWKGSINAQIEIDQARRVLQAILDTDNKAAGLYGLAGLEALEGNTEKALSYLEEAILLTKEFAKWAHRDIPWIELRDNPRYKELVSEKQHQRESGENKG